MKGTVVFYFPFFNVRGCICTLYIHAFDKPAPKRAFNVLRKTQQRKENILFSSAFISCGDVCVLLWNWCWLWRKIQSSFMLWVWKVHVWFTGITSLTHKRMKKHLNRAEHGVYVIRYLCQWPALHLSLWFWFDPTETSHVLMSDCLCKCFHSEVAEGCVSRWPLRFLWHSKTFQLWILLLFSAREPQITLMNHQTIIIVILTFITAIRIMMTFWSSVFIYSMTRSGIDVFHTCL